MRRPTLLLLGLVAVAACGGGSGSAPEPASDGGLAVYVDSNLQWRESREELLKRPTDLTRPGLNGWRIFGAIVPAEQRGRTEAIELVAAGGARLTIEQPTANYPDLEPVLFLDERAKDVRFAMVPAALAGRADRPLTLSNVSTLRVYSGTVLPPRTAAATPPAPVRPPVADATQPGPGGRGGGGGGRGAGGGGGGGAGAGGTGAGEAGSGGGTFELVARGKTERIDVGALRAFGKAEIDQRSGGEMWPLPALLKARVRGAVERVTVEGARGGRMVVEGKDLAGPRVYMLRVNRRGLIKFEVLEPGGGQGLRRVSDVADVARLDVAVK